MPRRSCGTAATARPLVSPGQYVLTALVVASLSACGGGSQPPIGVPGVAPLDAASVLVTVISEFTGPVTGSYPNGSLVIDSYGNLYGTAASGGVSGCLGFGCGTAFKLTRSSSGYTMSTIHEFGSYQDGDPEGGLIVDARGKLYGTTYFGPPNSYGPTGTVFALTPTASGYQETILYTFQNNTDGDRPVGSLVTDSTGALYGVTAYGGLGDKCDCGTVYKLTPAHSGYAESVLYRFKGGRLDGQMPLSLVLDARRDLYGVTELGGSSGFSYNGCGIAYELVRSGSAYTEKILHAFTGNADGAFPSGALTLDTFGNIYGATLDGGRGCRAIGCGTVFVLKRSPSTYTEHILYAFPGGSHRVDGIAPNGNLLIGASGTIFGTTRYDGARACLHSSQASCGTIFALTPRGAGYSESTLHVFRQTALGTVPMPGLAQGPDGAFYGTTAGGGDLQCSDSLPGCGTVYAATLSSGPSLISGRRSP